MFRSPFTILCALAAAVGRGYGAAAAPPPPPAQADADVVNVLLAVENLQLAFYTSSLAKFNQKSFSSLAEFALFRQVAFHENAHVNTLQALVEGLGAKPVAACTYNFPVTDVASFVKLSMLFEGVSAGAYLGALPLLHNTTVVSQAGAVLGTQARHAAFVALALGNDPWSDPFETPLTRGEALTLLAPFTKACPGSLTGQPFNFKPFPSLSASPSTNIGVDSVIKLTTPAKLPNVPLFAAFITGLTPEFVPWTPNGSVSVPDDANATSIVYMVITTSDTDVEVADAHTVAGPVIVTYNNQFAAATGDPNA
jgi:hypothetical protein